MVAGTCQTGAAPAAKDDLEALRSQVVCSIKDHVLRYMRASLAAMEESLFQLVEAEVAKLAPPMKEANSRNNSLSKVPTVEFEFEGEIFHSKAAVLEASELIESTSLRPVGVRTQDSLPPCSSSVTWATRRQIEPHGCPEKLAMFDSIAGSAKFASQPPNAPPMQRPRLGASNFVSAPGSSSAYRRENRRMEINEKSTEEWDAVQGSSSAPSKPALAPQHSLQRRVGKLRLARMQKPAAQPRNVQLLSSDDEIDILGVAESVKSQPLPGDFVHNADRHSSS